MGSFFQPLSYFKGGGSFYQSKTYFKGGSKHKMSRRRKNSRTLSKNGGFYPSVMGGVVDSGKLLIPFAIRQGYKLMNSRTRKVKSKKSKSLRKKNK